MTVTLIYPLLSKQRSKIDQNKQYWPPLGLAYIAALLERYGHTVKIIDRDVLLRKNGLDFEKTDKMTDVLIENNGSDIVGIGWPTPTISDIFHVAKRVKSQNPARLVIAGGAHVTAEPVLTLEDCTYIDGIGRGEGEFIMLELANGLPFEKILGLTYRRNGEIITNPDRHLYPDIDELPFPARHLLDMKFYTRPNRYISRNFNLRSTSILTARGCLYNCNFCAATLFCGQKVRLHSPQRVVEEIRELIEKYGVEGLYFAEDMFLINKARAKEFMHLFIENGFNRKIKWFAQIRANMVDEGLLKLMKEAGCAQVEYGFESGSQRVLGLMNKRAKVERNIQAAKMTRTAGLKFQGNIIVGYPGEREEDFKKTIKFLWKTHPHFIGFNLFMPLPGTPIYKNLREDGRLIPNFDIVGDQDSFNFNYADMPPGKFNRLYIRAKITTVLPINLFYFFKNNLNDPIRLFKISATQFWGVLLKLIRGLFK